MLEHRVLSSSIFNLVLANINDLLESNFIDGFESIEPKFIQKLLVKPKTTESQWKSNLIFRCIKEQEDFDDIQKLLSENTNKEFFLVCLGPDSYHEIIKEINDHPIFPDMHDLGDFLVKCSTSNVTASSDIYKIEYQSQESLLHDLKELNIISPDYDSTLQNRFPLIVSLEIIQVRFNTKVESNLVNEMEIPFLD